jgi:phosphohistidine phosphatase SixA
VEIVMLEARFPCPGNAPLKRAFVAAGALALVASSLGLPLPSALAAEPQSASLAPEALAQGLRAGGYVLVVRHAHSPFQVPSAGEAEPGNPGRERQLDAEGKAAARALGAALRSMHIPIGRIYSSPAFRARETIELAGLASAMIVPQLAEGAHGMASSAEESHAVWLRQAVDRAPDARTNTLLVTHAPNILGAFGRGIAGGIEGNQILVFQPRAGRPARFVGRLTVAAQ